MAVETDVLMNLYELEIPLPLLAILFTFQISELALSYIFTKTYSHPTHRLCNKDDNGCTLVSPLRVH